MRQRALNHSILIVLYFVAHYLPFTDVNARWVIIENKFVLYTFLSFENYLTIQIVKRDKTESFVESLQITRNSLLEAAGRGATRVSGNKNVSQNK